MSKIFVSHSSLDNAALGPLKNWLQTHGHESLFLDFDPDIGIQGGDRWEQTLYLKLRLSQLLLAFVTPHWNNSKWCFAEIIYAREKNKRVIPLKMADCDLPPIFHDTQYIDFATGEEDAWQQLANILKEYIDWDARRPPYPGLAAYEKEDAGVYYGRKDEILEYNQLLENLRRQSADAPKILLLLGASGSGKSSLVRAGMSPALKRNAKWLVIPPFRPQNDPFTGLANALAETYAGLHKPKDWEEIIASLKDPGKGLSELFIDLQGQHAYKNVTFLLTIDQAEELMSEENNAANNGFWRLIRQALHHARYQLLVLVTLRSNFLEKFQNNEVIRGASSEDALPYLTVILDAINPGSISEIIEAPAQRAGIVFETGLPAAMIQEAPNSDTLPLLAFTLRQLWDRHENGIITRNDYKALGGVEGSIKQVANDLVSIAGFSANELQQLRAIFIPALIRMNADGVYSKRTAFLDELEAGAQTLLQPFIDERLLVTDNDNNGRKTVEVTHEALLRTWPLLTRWLAEDADHISMYEGFRRAAQEWMAKGESPEFVVHRDGRLQELLKLLQERRFAVPPGSREANYLEACIWAQLEREAAKEAEEQRKLADAASIASTQKRLAGLRLVGLWLLGGLAAVVIVLGIVAVVQRNEAQRTAADLQNEVGLGAKVLSRATPNIAEALSSAVQANAATANEPANYLEAQEGLTATVSRMLYMTPLMSELPMETLLITDQDARTIIIEDGTISIWNLIDGQMERSLKALDHRPNGDFFAGDLSPDGRYIIAESLDILKHGLVQVWDLQQQRKTFEITYFNQNDTVRRYENTYFPLWQYYLFTTNSKKLIIPEPASMKAVPGKGSFTGSAWYGPTAVRILELETGSLIAKVEMSDMITCMAYDSVNNFLALGTLDGLIALWSLETNSLTSVFPNSTGDKNYSTERLQFFNGGSQLAASSREGLLKVWNLSDQRHPEFLFGKKIAMPIEQRTDEQEDDEDFQLKEPFSFSVLPGGSRVVTNDNGVCWLWTLNKGIGEGVLLNISEETDIVQALTVSWDGRLVATMSNRSIRIWDADQGYLLKQKDIDDIEGTCYIQFLPKPGAYTILYNQPGDYYYTWTLKGGEFIKTIWGLPQYIRKSEQWPGKKYFWDGDGTRERRIDVTRAFTSSDKRMFAVITFIGAVHIYTNSGQLISTLDARIDRSSNVCFTKNNKQLIAHSPGNELLLFETATGRRLTTIVTSGVHNGIADALIVDNDNQAETWAVSPDGKMLALAYDSRSDRSNRSTLSKPLYCVRLFDLATGALVKKLDHIHAMHGLAFSGDGSMLASRVEDTTLLVWFLKKNWKPVVLRGHKGHIWNMKFSGNGHLLVSASADSTAIIWDIEQGRPQFIYRAPEEVKDADVSPDKSRMILQGEERISLYDVLSQKETNRYIVHDEELVLSAGFLSNDTLYSAGADGLLKLYPVGMHKWYDKAVELDKRVGND